MPSYQGAKRLSTHSESRVSGKQPVKTIGFERVVVGGLLSACRTYSDDMCAALSDQGSHDISDWKILEGVDVGAEVDDKVARVPEKRIPEETVRGRCIVRLKEQMWKSVAECERDRRVRFKVQKSNPLRAVCQADKKNRREERKDVIR